MSLAEASVTAPIGNEFGARCGASDVCLRCERFAFKLGASWVHDFRARFRCKELKIDLSVVGQENNVKIRSVKLDLARPSLTGTSTQQWPSEDELLTRAVCPALDSNWPSGQWDLAGANRDDTTMELSHQSDAAWLAG